MSRKDKSLWIHLTKASRIQSGIMNKEDNVLATSNLPKGSQNFEKKRSFCLQQIIHSVFTKLELGKFRIHNYS
ncbi:MAG: hypothetical protein RBR14_00235 [Candidatus Cloacimonas acidaminovorans]|nr:hypothetical protein [Candidatus Cloacimonas acidaminovorans]